jgi:hypothetical protein
MYIDNISAAISVYATSSLAMCEGEDEKMPTHDQYSNAPPPGHQWPSRSHQLPPLHATLRSANMSSIVCNEPRKLGC